MSRIDVNWPAVSTLAISIILTVVVVSGCARVDSSPKAAATQTRPQTTKHNHTPWRYRHMGHRHTRPNLGSGNPVFPDCAVCRNKSEEEISDAS